MSAAPPCQPTRPDAASLRCAFEHSLFSRMEGLVFRPAEADGAPSLVVPLGSGTAALPLRSLQAELGIAATSPDGRMMALVARALDFVAELRLGDALPVEVLDGAASWQPSALHQQVAEGRLKLRLLNQLAMGENADWCTAEPRTVLAAAADPDLPPRLQVAFVEAAARLELPDATALTRLLADAAHELGFIEALRDRLLRRVLQLAEQLQHLTAGQSQNLSGLELLSRVRRLTGIAAAKIEARFAALEAESEAVLDLLRLLDDRRPALRKHRDWLYCSLRGWEPILSSWDVASSRWSNGTWALLSRTYRFLAPRFMPVQEWQSSSRPKVGSDTTGERMVW